MLSWERIVKLGDIKIAIIIEPEVKIYWSVIHLLRDMTWNFLI